MTRAWLVVLWVVGALGVVVWWALTASLGSSACELGQGTSVYGEPGWSWWPPGRTCTWTAEQTGVGVLTQDAPVGPAFATVVVLGWPLLVAAGYRAGRRERSLPVSGAGTREP